MSDSTAVFVFLPAMFLCILLFVEIGRRIGVRRRAGETERERVVESTIETAIYALLGLMVAFTFAGAASRFDVRRAQTVQEANAIGTAYLRLVLPALNDMIDITTTRAVALRTHTPPVILATLAVLSLVCSLLIGYGLAGGKPFGMLLHMLGFALVLTVTIYVILDLDHPRVGLIRLDYADQALKDVLAGMK